MKLMQFFMEIRGIEIPDAYTPLDTWKEIHLDSEPDSELIRFFQASVNQEIAFVLDPNNIELIKLQEELAGDTKKLRAALRLAFDRADFDKTILSSRPSKTKTRLSFLIRSPFFSMLPKERIKQQDRMYCGSNKSVFIFHVDINRKMQILRLYHNRTDQSARNFADHLGLVIQKYSKFFTEHYGKWDEFAEKITQCITEVIGPEAEEST